MVEKSCRPLRLLVAAGVAPLMLALLLALFATALAPGSASAQDAGPSAPDATAAIPPAVAALRINEFMASNNTVLEDPDDPGQFPDWIEIYNPGASAVNLANAVALTDDPDGNPTKSPITQTLIVPAQGFLVLYADNEPQQGAAHLDFALSAAGEAIGLFYIVGGTPQEIDRYEFGPQTSNVSEGRTPDGSATWAFFPVSTPGESNDLRPPTIVSVTRAVPIPAAGNPVTVTAVITDDGTLTASLVYTSSANAAEQSLPMSPLAGNQYQASLPGQANGVYVSYRVRAQDNEGNVRFSTPQGYLVGYQPPVLFLNEVVAENFGAVEDVDDEDGEYPDWLEIYNPGSAAVQLQGLSLTDNPREPEKFRIEQSISLAPKAFIMVYLDDDPEQTNTTNIHTNFSLNKDGEFIGLYGGRGSVLIDGTEFGKQLDNVAFGRYPDGVGPFRQLLCTTPGKPNIDCVPQQYLPITRTRP
jgi:hypothetical protein